MTRRHGLYLASAIAATGLVLELGWAIADRIHLHMVDRGVRTLDQLRTTVHM